MMIARTFLRNLILIANGRPSATFCNGKFKILDGFCYAEFLTYYILGNKLSNTGEYQPDRLDDIFIENNHEKSSYPPKMKLMISK